MGRGKGCPLFLYTEEGFMEGAVPIPRKIFEFVSQKGELWCKLGGNFLNCSLEVGLTHFVFFSC